MKKLFFALVFFVPMLVGCEMLGEFTKIPLPYDDDFTIPTLPVPQTITLNSPESESDLDSTLQELKLTSKVIDKLYVSEMELSIKDAGSNDNFDFLDELTMSIIKDGKEYKVASVKSADIAAGSKSVTMKCDLTNLKEAALAGKSNGRYVIKTKKPLLKELNVDVTGVMILDLKVLGL